MTVVLPDVCVDITPTTLVAEGQQRTADAALGGVGLQSAEALNVFFLELLQFLRDFSSVTPAERAASVSPRRVHRAAVRPGPAAEALITRSPKPGGSAAKLTRAAAPPVVTGLPSAPAIELARAAQPEQAAPAPAKQAAPVPAKQVTHVTPVTHVTQGRPAEAGTAAERLAPAASPAPAKEAPRKLPRRGAAAAAAPGSVAAPAPTLSGAPGATTPTDAGAGAATGPTVVVAAAMGTTRMAPVTTAAAHLRVPPFVAKM